MPEWFASDGLMYPQKWSLVVLICTRRDSRRAGLSIEIIETEPSDLK